MKIRDLLVLWVAGACWASVVAQTPAQVVKPPLAQAWIDVATYSGAGGMGMARPGAGGLDAMRGMFGGRSGEAKVPFGMTQSMMSSGRYVDVTLMSRSNAQMAEATQQVPAAFLAPALKLVSPQTAAPTPVERSDDEVVPDKEPPPKPEGKLYLYWGCGDAVRPGQPKVLDFATASAAELGQFFQARRATTRGAHAALGRPSWPNAVDGRAVPEAARLTGEHSFAAAGLPENFRFQVPAAQDLMPPLQIKQADVAGALALSWSAVPAARAYFLAAMTSRGRNDMVLWSSSEVPETGFGLIDYQPNGAVDRWLREGVLLSAGTTKCAVPKGVLGGEGGMIRAIAYGSELWLAHPPRPTDPAVPWEPQWAVKLRVKSVGFAAAGMPSMDMAAEPAGEPGAAKDGQKKSDEQKAKQPSAVDLLRGVLGR